MAQSLISGVLYQLGSFSAQKAIQEGKQVWNVEKDVSRIKNKLEAIQALLKDAEKKQLESDAARLWLDRLKDVSYDIDNVVDEWITEDLISRIQKQEDEEVNDALVLKILKKVCFSLPSWCFCLTQLEQVPIRRQIAVKIKQLYDELDEIEKDRRAYSLQTAEVVPNNKRRETTSFVDVSEVHGRDVDKEYLISKLLCDSSTDGGKGPVIIPIVGIGGIGKTTLAKLAFNDDKVKENFNKRVWVCVSDPFDEIGIAKAILQELQLSLPDEPTLQALLQRIREYVEGKKFLIVLDDVWTEESEKWEDFIQHFRSGAAGSRLLITTRKETVAIMMRVATQMINLELLSDEHCWSIISHLAFVDRNSGKREQLEEIGRKIAKKCKGLPLQARTLGGLLRFKETKRDWEDVLSNQIWESQDKGIKHFAPFLLSYYDLPPLEQRCFSYCSVFPKDYKFERDDLIQMWMSQGYLSSNVNGENKNPENEGRKCFKNLTMQSLFQDFQKDDDGSIVRCKMHDILHDLALFLTKNECFTMKVDEGNTQPRTVKKVRHLTLLLTRGGDMELATSMLNEGNLQSLFMLWLHKSTTNGLRLPDQTSPPLRYLRTLNMSRCGISRLPGQLIGQLRHLRYFNLSYNSDLTELPDEVCDLCNLQTLTLLWCSSLERLPEGMGKLVNLRHLRIVGCDNLKELPKGIGRLTQLQTLDRVVIAEKNEEEYLSIGDLEKMNHLQFESATQITGCGNLKSLSEAEKVAGLVKRGNLVQLDLEFHPKKDVHRKEDDEFMILEALQPHQSLKSLLIVGYGGANLSPKWMTSLGKLTRLVLYGCEFFETFPPLGRLPFLEELFIWKNRELRKIGGELMGITSTTSCTTSSSDVNVAKGGGQTPFPKLKHLSLFGMRRWEEWEGCESTTNMPCLNYLDISICNSLKSLPQFLKETPLKHLSINYCEILSKSLRRSRQEWTHISHVPNITIDEKFVKIDSNRREDAQLFSRIISLI